MKKAREVGGGELLKLMVATVGHARSLTMVGASVVCGLMGASEWPAMGEVLQSLGYCEASVYNLRADFRRVAERLAEIEGRAVDPMVVVHRAVELSRLTGGALSC